MVKKTHTLNLQRWRPRALARLALPVVAALVFSISFIQLWGTETGDVTFVRTQRHGVAYLQPLTALMVKLVKAQSMAVDGQIVDVPGVRAGVAAVDRVDREYGKELSTSRRWSDVRDRVDELMNQRPLREAAYTGYTDAVKLVRDLMLKVGDTSNLVLDSELDSYYLIDAALVRVPGLLTFVGRAADLARLSAEAQKERYDRNAAIDAQQRISVARYQVALDKEAISSGLGKAIEATESTTLGPNITSRLDTFSSAVDGFVPPVNLLESIDKVDAGKLAETAGKVREATEKLAGTVLSELNALLRVRGDGVSTTRSRSLLVGLLALLSIAAVAWLLVKTGGGLRGDRDDTPDSVTRAADEGRHGTAGTEQADEDEVIDLGDPQAAEELVHVGRGIKTRRRERVDDVR